MRIGRRVLESLKKIQLLHDRTIFHRKDNILLQIWNNEKQNVNMISTIHSARLIEFNNINRKSTVPVQKPKSIIYYNKWKGIDCADQYFLYYLNVKKIK